MIRLRAAVAIVALLALTACSGDEEPAAPPPPAAAPPASATAEAAPESPGPLGDDSAPPAKPEITRNPDGTVNSGGPRPRTTEAKLNAGGIGPYRIGISQKQLAGAKLVTGAKNADCPQHVSAKGTSAYGSPELTFFEGRLLRLTLAGKATTDKGVALGAPLADVQKAYPDGTQLEDWSGRPGWLVESGDYALLFELDNDKVSAIHAGMGGPLRFRYTDNQGC